MRRFFSNPYFWGVFVLIAFTIPFIRTYQKQASMEPLPILGQIEHFELTNQAGALVSWEEFYGKVVVTNFIFTSCPEICPMMSTQMQRIQLRLNYVRDYVRLVSITVDPANDTPEVLAQYAQRFNANFKVWTFLTGPYDSIKKVVTESYRMAMDNGDPNQNFFDIVHGEQFVISDHRGRIRSYRPAKTKDDVERIIKDITVLINAPVANPSMSR